MSSNFFTRRCRGQVPFAVLFWRDMLGVGTLVNLVTTFLALIAMIQEGPAWLAVSLHLLPLPYNIFLFVVLWRRPDRNDFVSTVAVVWLVIMILI